MLQVGALLIAPVIATHEAARQDVGSFQHVRMSLGHVVLGF